MFKLSRVAIAVIEAINKKIVYGPGDISKYSKRNEVTYVHD